jgi:hypothetical protein
MMQYRAPAWIVLDESMQLAPVTAGVVEPEVPHGRHRTAIMGAWLALQTPWLVHTLQP